MLAVQLSLQPRVGHFIYAADAIELLTQVGIDCAQHKRHGIDVAESGELLTSSGVVLNEDVSWVSFHSGFDFGYLVKVMTSSALPAPEMDFTNLLATYFPRLYDMKYLMLASDKLYGGLNELAEIYHVDRHGQMHQAGSDSLVMLHVFLRIMEETFRGAVPLPLAGILFGLGSGRAAACRGCYSTGGVNPRRRPRANAQRLGRRREVLTRSPSHLARPSWPTLAAPIRRR